MPRAKAAPKKPEQVVDDGLDLTVLTRYYEEFVSADNTLKNFIKESSEFMNYLRKLAEDRNTKLIRVQNELKNTLKNSARESLAVGSFTASVRVTETWDPDKLRDLLPDRFVDMILTPTTSYSVNEAELENLLKRKLLREDAVRQAFSRNFTTVLGRKCPKEITIP